MPHADTDFADAARDRSARETAAAFRGITPHADTDTGADVTALALATIGDAMVRAGQPVSQGLLGTLEFNAHARADVPVLCDIAAAAVRLVNALSDPNPADDEPWWWNRASDECLTCFSGALHWSTVEHFTDCAAMQLDAAIRAAAESDKEPTS